MEHAPSPRRPPPPLVIGVVGGIASGKSLVARLLAGPEGFRIDADQVAREVLDSAEVRELVRAAFGPAVFGPTGTLERERLAARVFASDADRKQLEAFTHPRIRARIRALLEDARARRVPRVVLDVPLLLENEAQHGLAAECHELVFVDSPLAARDARAVASRAWASGEVARREAAQLSLDQKRKRANHVIDNSKSPGELEADVAQLSQTLALRWRSGAPDPH
jgi:dephospho-CoA kinase